MLRACSPSSSACRRSPDPYQHEVGVAPDVAEPQPIARRIEQPLRLGNCGAIGVHVRLIGQRRFERRDHEDVEAVRRERPAQPRQHVFARDDRAHAHPGEPVRLRERASDDDVRERVEVRDEAVAAELDVGLVEQQQRAGRQQRREPRDLVERQRHATRVAGAGHEQRAGGWRDRRGDGRAIRARDPGQASPARPCRQRPRPHRRTCRTPVRGSPPRSGSRCRRPARTAGLPLSCAIATAKMPSSRPFVSSTREAGTAR